ncbi:hypothetical protein AVEN_165984-1 [Araneus ventricosus]|uniref:Uncharacterized protein n=1 Tax=Araneus ventricosus TaxID=182803 RepID=A0A4Y2PI21_ARAVE|nr:hypothetical protein AVEN_165984-1 [Araneus ventricosus]
MYVHDLSDPMQNPDLFGGDMLGVNPHDKNVIPGFQLRWPGAVVAYEIDPSLGKIFSPHLHCGMEWQMRIQIALSDMTSQLRITCSIDKVMSDKASEYAYAIPAHNAEMWRKYFPAFNPMVDERNGVLVEI